MAGKFPGHFRLFAARGCTESVAGGRIDPRTWPPFRATPTVLAWGKSRLGEKIMAAFGRKNRKTTDRIHWCARPRGERPCGHFLHYLTAQCGLGKCTTQACVPLKPLQAAVMHRTPARLRPWPLQRARRARDWGKTARPAIRRRRQGHRPPRHHPDNHGAQEPIFHKRRREGLRPHLSTTPGCLA